MSYNNYLLNLANISNEIGYSLTYGYGDIAATEINSLKALIAKSEEMIPILEAEACFNEAEELDREEQSFNYWMTMLYGKGDVISPMDSHSSSKANRLNRRKQNKKNKSRDRIHGRRHGGMHGGVDFRYIDCNPFCNKHRYEDAMFYTNGKHRHNTDKRASAMDAREKEDTRLFTGLGELLENIAYLEDRIYIYEEDIKDLEYEKAFGYLTERGEEFLEEYKKELKELKEYKKDKEVLLRTATR